MKVTRDFHHALGRLRQELALYEEAKEVHFLGTPEGDRLADTVKMFLEAIPEEKARARSGDPDTSKEAADGIDEEKLRIAQENVLHCFRYHLQNGDNGKAGLTDEELIRHYDAGITSFGWTKQTDSGIRTRRKELTGAGYVEIIGTRMNTNNRKVRVYRYTGKPAEFDGR